MRLVLIVILGLSYLLNSVILQKIYDVKDWNEYLKFVSVRNNVYEIMFALFFWLTYLSSAKGTVIRSLACCFAILAAGSAIDKCFGITSYLKSDVLLIIISIAISVYGFIRERKQRG